MRFLHLLFVSVCLLNGALAQQRTSSNGHATTFPATGYVRDVKTGKPIQGVNIVVLNVSKGYVTAKDGFYIVQLPPGNYILRFSHVGYRTKEDTISLQKTLFREITMEDDAKDLEEVVVTSETPDRNVRKVEIGVSQLSIRSIRRIPPLMGEVDIVRSLLLLPGVTTVGEGAPGFNVRGGSADQNLILFDDAPVFNSSHLMGFFSVFNPDVVRDVTLNRGGVAAMYGGRASSVLDVKIREPSAEKWGINGGIGIISSRLGIEGPIVKNKLSFLAAARASFNDFLFKLAPPNLKDTKANFYDLTSKLKYQPNEQHTITLTGYVSTDVFKLASDSLSGQEINASSTQFNYQTLTGSLRWNYFISKQLNLATSAIFSRYQADLSSPDSANAFQLKSGIWHRQIKSDFTYTPNETHQWQAGISAIDYLIQPNTRIPGPFSNVLPVDLARERAYELAAYVQDEWKLNTDVSVVVGLRYSTLLNRGPETVRTYQENGPRQDETVASTKTYGAGRIYHSAGGLEPRLAVRWSVGEGKAIKAGYSRLRQYIQQITNTTAALPTSRWHLSDSYTKPQIADQWALGYFRNTSDNDIEASGEVYYKTLTNAIDYRDGAELQLAEAVETQIVQGSGQAYGFEGLLRKNKGLWSGFISYTYARTFLTMNSPYAEERVNNGRAYAANYDKPHTLNVLAIYRPTTWFSLSLNFTYSTGRPTTQPSALAKVGGILVPIYLDRNQQRVPDYHRLDFSMTFEQNPLKKKRNQSNWVFSIYNVYAHKNAYSIFYKLSSASSTDAYKLSIFGTAFPSLTYNFKF
ncbi:TonB-dependent receptor [Spirosoma endbachense]|uniref:TonB-dependent receptor plug domain-containing protein n=1 Tax=Spirosoma endbachense TaxID=2666025 RepID=A0A6P1W2C4_9BACT|nr:TonB-dependent receptor [Spirosoma endbachense]QHV99581.1 TonB-dependent receptor plug domain-containing protein [Spirosoma endbachense]